MKVSDFLNKDLVMPDLEAKGKREAIEEMVALVSSKVDGIDKEKLMEALLEREKLGSTGIGYGVAIPHAKLKKLDSIVVAFGRSKRGVDFQSMDKKPVHIFFLIVASENSTAMHLRILASISNLLKDANFRKRLIESQSKDDIYRIIVEEDERILKGALL